MALQIEPCPFCGGHHLHMVVHSLTYSVACQSCRCRGPQRKNQELAVMQWNVTSLSSNPEVEDTAVLVESQSDTSELINRRLSQVIDHRLAKPSN